MGLSARARRRLNGMNPAAAATQLGDRCQFLDPSGGLFGSQGGLGQVFFVDSANGSAGNRGTSFTDDAISTLNAAIALCTASRGDVIYVAPGHAEALTDTNTIDLDVAGVQVRGLGDGTMRPKFTYDHTAAIFEIGANNCTISNLTFMASVPAVVVGVEVEAGVTGTVIEDCEFLPGEDGGGTDEFVETIEVEAGCNNTAIRRCKFREHASASASVAAIMLTGASTGVEISDCDIKGQYSTACINSDGAAQVDMRILRNLLTPKDAEPGIECYAASSGTIADNYISTDLATLAAAIVATGTYMFENYMSEVVTETGGLIGTASTDG